MYICEICGTKFDEFAIVRKEVYHKEVDGFESVIEYRCPICCAEEEFCHDE